MKLLFLGDVVGRAGRDAVLAWMKEIRSRVAPDFVVLNGENAAHGFGLTPKICDDFYAAGVDVVTLGNHAWDHREILNYIDGEPRLLRALNFPPGTPGRGVGVYTLARGRRVAVIQVMGRLFMDALDCPFAALERELARLRLGPGGLDAILVDVHAEATSEKMALGHSCDGRVTLVVGTHSHIPTADAQILPRGTAYLTDAGMCGDYDSVIGMKKIPATQKFTRKVPGERLSPADGTGTVCGVLVETDEKTGLATRIAPLRVGPRLETAWPV
ncbi:TIGR00282 family metallophosphoesterase [Phaeospirillum tilakii]|uniref:YmdB family metallophosphoesterase n=1 Tax=Phaeospirillum tilakii TaxID=741673 RepID=A0ABW5CA52_9PROT